MASVYTNDLRLEEIGSGEQSGTWGDTTNTNLELIAEGLSYGTEGITTNANTHTSTVADGATDPARSMYIEYTGTLDSACTITIAPNTLSRMHFIENGTSGSQNIIIKQGSGATITIPPGDTKAVYLDGAGSGAAVVDAFASLSVVDLKVQDDLTVTDDLIVGGDIDLEGSIDVNGTANLDVTNIVGDLTVTGDTITFTSANANDPALKLINTTNDTDGAELQIRKDKGAAGADGDIVGLISFIGDDAAQQQHIFAKMAASIVTAADGSEGGKLAFGVASHDAEFQNGLVLQDGNAEDEVDVTIGNGAASVTTIAGNLSLTSDGAILNIGADSDLKISHSGSAATINNDTGDLSIQSDGNLKLERKDGGEDYIHCIADGAVELHHNGTKTFETAADGISVTGDVAITSGGTLDVFNSGNASTTLTALLGADNGGGNGRTNSTTKTTVIGLPHYTNSEEAVGLIVAGSTSNSNFIDIGGGGSVINGATEVNIHTAANITTTGGTKRLTVNSAGDIDVKTGDIFFSTAGKGIVLGATSNTAANTLDDYEEGTFTPTWDGYSASGSAGRYTKTGNQVIVHAQLVTGGSSDFSGVSITNLPFTAANVSGVGSGFCWCDTAADLYSKITCTRITQNTTICVLNLVNNGGFTSMEYVGRTPQLGGNATFEWTLIYQTT